MATAELTDRQNEVMGAIWEHWRRYQVPPTLRELMAMTGVKSPNGIVGHLRLLASKGAIEWDRDGRSRMIFPAGLREKIKGVVG